VRNALFTIAATALAGAPLMAAEAPQPVHLQIKESGDGVELLVTGAAGAGAEARFELEVESRGAGGTTRTTQSGINRKGGAGGVLLTSRIHTSGLSHWTARLHVRSDGAEYSETRSSAG